jgi:hypothetical protein
MSGVLSPFSQYAFMTCTGTNLKVTLHAIEITSKYAVKTGIILNQRLRLLYEL